VVYKIQTIYDSIHISSCTGIHFLLELPHLIASYPSPVSRQFYFLERMEKVEHVAFAVINLVIFMPSTHLSEPLGKASRQFSYDFFIARQ
jgi:hypothetical protein